MILVKPEVSIIRTSHLEMEKFIEECGRTCYKSNAHKDRERTTNFIHNLINNGHGSVLEHGVLSVKFICDRGVSHELVRHRIASFSQESTRYCNYAKKGMTFVIPPWTNIGLGEYISGKATGIYNYNELKWLTAMSFAENFYNELLRDGWTPQQARAVLPNSLKTEVIMTANLREWRAVFNLRCDKAAHPQMRELMLPLLESMYNLTPDFFFDIYEKFCGDKEDVRKKCS
jgi:thymidylate synthase (FAD)